MNYPRKLNIVMIGLIKGRVRGDIKATSLTRDEIESLLEKDFLIIHQLKSSK